jgi:hypothetical protein
MRIPLNIFTNTPLDAPIISFRYHRSGSCSPRTHYFDRLISPMGVKTSRSPTAILLYITLGYVACAFRPTCILPMEIVHVFISVQRYSAEKIRGAAERLTRPFSLIYRITSTIIRPLNSLYECNASGKHRRLII